MMGPVIILDRQNADSIIPSMYGWALNLSCKYSHAVGRITAEIQEYIPVGCVPSAAMAVGGGGVFAPVHACWDMFGQGGCLSQCMLGYTPAPP